MNDLEKNFVIGRGDLIYGFEKGRDLYINNSPKLGAAAKVGCWIIANNFNDNTILRFNQFYTPCPDTTSQQEQINQIIQALKQCGKLEGGLPFIKALYRRYPPSEVKNIDLAKLNRTGDSHNFKMIRRSCKFGIEYVAGLLDGNAKVHFVLDYMPDEADILSKKKYNGRVPITVSELRYVFRNWRRLSGRIVFYKSLREDFAPWESNPQAWRKYAIERLDKYAKLAGKAHRDDLHPQFDPFTATLSMLLGAADQIKQQLHVA
jgi:hypothetical protein